MITWFDNFSILLRRDQHVQLVYTCNLYNHACIANPDAGADAEDLKIAADQTDGYQSCPSEMRDCMRTIQRDAVGSLLAEIIIASSRAISNP